MREWLSKFLLSPPDIIYGVRVPRKEQVVTFAVLILLSLVYHLLAAVKLLKLCSTQGWVCSAGCAMVLVDSAITTSRLPVRQQNLTGALRAIFEIRISLGRHFRSRHLL